MTSVPDTLAYARLSGYLITMRVTGGIYQNRNIECPKGIIRPVMDRMRESLFSIFGNLKGVCFVDLFCGSGIMGIEAASRGADCIVFVEKDRRKAPVLRENIEIIEKPFSLYLTDVERYLASERDNTGTLVFLDPPFNLKNKARLLSKAAHSPAVSPQALIVLHFPAEEEREVARIIGLRRTELRRYGRSWVGFYRRDA